MIGIAQLGIALAALGIVVALMGGAETIASR